MKAIVRASKTLAIEVEGETQKALFQAVVSAMEVFGVAKCGLCGCEDIIPVVRKVTKKKKEYEYPEWHCRNPKCRARLTLSYNMEGGGMFPNRRLLPAAPGQPPDCRKPATGDEREKGEFTPSGGWTKYRGEPKPETEE